MSDLSRTLTEAAWAEMKDPPYTNWAYSELPQRAQERVRRTVAAVLDAVAGPEQLSGVRVDWRLQASDLRRLAGEIREQA